MKNTFEEKLFSRRDAMICVFCCCLTLSFEDVLVPFFIFLLSMSGYFLFACTFVCLFTAELSMISFSFNFKRTFDKRRYSFLNEN